MLFIIKFIKFKPTTKLKMLELHNYASNLKIRNENISKRYLKDTN